MLIYLHDKVEETKIQITFVLVVVKKKVMLSLTALATFQSKKKKKIKPTNII